MHLYEKKRKFTIIQSQDKVEAKNWVEYYKQAKTKKRRQLL